MKENVGRVDRVLRSVIGPSLIFAGYQYFGGRLGRPLGLIGMMTGVAILESAITRVCPVNSVLGIDTSSREGYRYPLVEQELADSMNRLQ